MCDVMHMERADFYSFTRFLFFHHFFTKAMPSGQLISFYFLF